MALRLGKCLLRSRRRAAGLTQVELSERLYDELGLDVSPTTISHYETGRRTMSSPVVMRGICIILRCNEADLYEFLR
ncbi:helix-turn-helix transcriptional regulator [Paenibacillus cineris]|jgi:transcriptional regulator with XRE-family HTH domain|uniref:HTH cro/C1-type domain-containing protein n=1 Tax=Paenibacillus cineris TaxID=237530 RepID=A0ABQ4LN50_9BACL|nr:hypothetical protein J21TS7_62700 [Paenibacillus cineris]